MWTQIIYKTRDKCLCRQALRESFTLQELLNHGRSLECIDEQAKRLEGHHSQMPTLALNAVDTQLNQSRFLLNNSGFRVMDYITIAETKMAYITNDKRENRLCHPSNCPLFAETVTVFFSHKGGMRSCPAQGTECHGCHKLNHFPKFCLSSQSTAHGIQHVTGDVTQPEPNSSETDDEYLFTIHSTTTHPETTVIINAVPVTVIVDSYAPVNVLNEATVDCIEAQNANFWLMPSTVKIHAYGAKQPLHIAGQFYRIYFCLQWKVNRTDLPCF